MQRTQENHLQHTSYGPKSLKYLKHIRWALFIIFTRFEDVRRVFCTVGNKPSNMKTKHLNHLFFFSCVVTFLWTCPPPLPRFPSCLRHSGDPLKKTLSSLSLTSSEPLTNEPSPALAAQMAEEEDYDWVYKHAVRELAEWREGCSRWNCKTSLQICSLTCSKC